MNRLSVLFVCFAVALLSFVDMAGAQATRTWVSGVGDDANPCSRTAPCKTFAGAISKTAAKGEINVLDPGGFGGVTITKSISIIAEGVTAGVLVSGTNAIVVNLPNAADNVVLKGLDIEGVGTGLAGIRMIGNGNLTVIDCLISDFTAAGSGYGIDVQSTTGARVMIKDSTLSGNNGGFLVRSTTVPGYMVVSRTTIDRNINFAIRVENPNFVFVSDSVVGGTLNAFQATAGGTITSFGNNTLRNAVPTNTTPLQ